MFKKSLTFEGTSVKTKQAKFVLFYNLNNKVIYGVFDASRGVVGLDGLAATYPRIIPQMSPTLSLTIQLRCRSCKIPHIRIAHIVLTFLDSFRNKSGKPQPIRTKVSRLHAHVKGRQRSRNFGRDRLSGGEIWVRDHSRSLVPFESLGAVSCFHSNYGYILHHFRDKARYWSKIVLFSYPLHSTPP